MFYEMPSKCHCYTRSVFQMKYIYVCLYINIYICTYIFKNVFFKIRGCLFRSCKGWEETKKPSYTFALPIGIKHFANSKMDNAFYFVVHVIMTFCFIRCFKSLFTWYISLCFLCTKIMWKYRERGNFQLSTFYC